ncbi:MAG: hypothetical protein ABIF19_15580 [Planctomycetota bacterium]
MHIAHGVFAEGLAQKKKLKLTFFSRKLCQNVLTVCAPLHYSEGRTQGDGQDSYYFWDYGARRAGNNLLALSPTEILSMELTKEAFDINEFSSTSHAGRDSTTNPGARDG